MVEQFSAGPEQHIPHHDDVSPPQFLVAHLLRHGKFAQRLARLRVQLQRFVLDRHKQGIIRGRDVRSIHIHAYANRVLNPALPKGRTVIGVIRHHHFGPLHEQSAIDRQRTDGPRMTPHHVLAARLAIPQHAQRPLHQLVSRRGGIGRVAVQAIPVRRVVEFATREMQPAFRDLQGRLRLGIGLQAIGNFLHARRRPIRNITQQQLPARRPQYPRYFIDRQIHLIPQHGSLRHNEIGKVIR